MKRYILLLLPLLFLCACVKREMPAEEEPRGAQIILCGTAYTGTESELTLPGGELSFSDLQAALPSFPLLERLCISDCGFSPAEQLSLLSAYPRLDFAWDVTLGERRLPSHSKELTVSGGEIPALLENAALLPEVQRLDFGTELLPLENIAALRSAYGEAEILCRTRVGSMDCVSTETVLEFSEGSSVTLQEIEAAMSTLPCLTKLILPDGCGFSDEELDTLNRKYETVKLVWTVHFSHWAVRSDITCFSTLQAVPVRFRYTEADFVPLLTYCTDLVALDLGHNDIRDLSLFANLKKLKALILLENQHITDISPLGELQELEYLELCSILHINDFSPLQNCHKMVDLNLSYCPNLSEVYSLLDEMPKLRRGWLIYNMIPYEERARLEERYANVEFFFAAPESPSSTYGGWRMNERNQAIRTAFTNWEKVVEFRSWDDIVYEEGATIYQAQPSYG